MPPLIKVEASVTILAMCGWTALGLAPYRRGRKALDVRSVTQPAANLLVLEHHEMIHVDVHQHAADGNKGGRASSRKTITRRACNSKALEFKWRPLYPNHLV